MKTEKNTPLRVVFSLDTEEEGLFSGHYARHNCGVRNIERLLRLAPITDALGFPLTLFCSYTVLSSTPALRVLETMRGRYGAEIGAHLHHWSTPPFGDCSQETAGTPERTDRMPRALLEARLENLLAKARSFLGEDPVSFRMGRWDLKRVLFPLLLAHGIHADSSVCPLRAHQGGADHFLAPAVPYWPMGRNVPFLEVPLTQIPLHPFLARLWYGRFRGRPALDRFHFLAALSPNPFWHGGPVMRLSARLLALRGGPVLSMFCHSSELMPGGSPHVPDEAAAARVLGRIGNFLAWLRESMPVRGVTLGEVFREAWEEEHGQGSGLVCPERSSLSPADGDW